MKIYQASPERSDYFSGEVNELFVLTNEFYHFFFPAGAPISAEQLGCYFATARSCVYMRFDREKNVPFLPPSRNFISAPAINNDRTAGPRYRPFVYRRYFSRRNLWCWDISQATD